MQARGRSSSIRPPTCRWIRIRCSPTTRARHTPTDARSSTMTMQVSRTRLVATVFAALLTGAFGCDDVHTGDLTDPGGPILLERVIVQDSPAAVSNAASAGTTTRGGAVDLLETATPPACGDAAPCQVLFAMQGGLGDFTCR